MGNEDVRYESESKDKQRSRDISRDSTLNTEEVGEADDENDASESAHHFEYRLETKEVESGIVVKIEGGSREGRNDERGEPKQWSQTGIIQGASNEWRGEKKEDSDGRHEENLKTDSLTLDAENFFRGAFKDFGQVFGHSSWNTVANEDNHHGGQGDHEAVAAIISWTKDTTDC